MWLQHIWIRVYSSSTHSLLLPFTLMCYSLLATLLIRHSRDISLIILLVGTPTRCYYVICLISSLLQLVPSNRYFIWDYYSLLILIKTACVNVNFIVTFAAVTFYCYSLQARLMLSTIYFGICVMSIPLATLSSTSTRYKHSFATRYF